MSRKTRWVVRQTPGDYQALGQKYGIEPLLLLIAKNRGVEEENFTRFFCPSRDDLYDPGLIKEVPEAAEILMQKIGEHKKIRVIGDYDIDGVCATVILTEGLRKLGADVDFSVPHRINDGYGLNMNLVDAAIKSGVDTIITCDNGIAAYKEIEYAVDKGITVIVTDHHEIPYDLEGEVKKYRLPPAHAVVDIKREDETYPFKDLCGACVAWKLLIFLEQKMGADIDSYRYVELAGFATVGDVMQLKGENRTITALGLDAMKHSAFVGLRALVERCEIKPEDLRCYHIGFRLGPCINATGRLDSADRAIKLLMETDEKAAADYAAELVGFNTERQALTDKGVESVLETMERDGMSDDNVLVVYVPGIHESIAGIIAGRIKEKFYRPSIVLTDGEECVKGSARSIEGYSMYDKLNECAGLFIKFGGHPMAAGMSIARENVDKLRRFLNEHAGIDEETITEKITIDAVVPFSYIDAKLVGQLEKLEPTGNGNVKPLFAAKDVQIKKLEFRGPEKQHVNMTLYDGTAKLEAMVWNVADEIRQYFKDKYGANDPDKAISEGGSTGRLDIIFSPEINSWNGKTKVQLKIKDYRFNDHS